MWILFIFLVWRHLKLNCNFFRGWISSLHVFWKWTSWTCLYHCFNERFLIFSRLSLMWAASKWSHSLSCRISKAYLVNKCLSLVKIVVVGFWMFKFIVLFDPYRQSLPIEGYSSVPQIKHRFQSILFHFTNLYQPIWKWNSIIIL